MSGHGGGHGGGGGGGGKPLDSLLGAAIEGFSPDHLFHAAEEGSPFKEAGKALENLLPDLDPIQIIKGKGGGGGGSHGGGHESGGHGGGHH